MTQRPMVRVEADVAASTDGVVRNAAQTAPYERRQADDMGIGHRTRSTLGQRATQAEAGTTTQLSQVGVDAADAMTACHASSSLGRRL